MNLADCYRLLGLRTGASYDEIKASYRRLAREYHPDVNPDNQSQSQEKFIQLTEAYKYLLRQVQAGQASGSGASRAETSSRYAARPTSGPTSGSASGSASGPAPTPRVKVTRKPAAAYTAPDLSQTDQQLKQNAYEQLQQFLKDHRFPRAIALVEGLAQRLPNDVEVRQWQAITYQRWGRQLVNENQPDKARIYLKKALRTDPHNKSLWYEVERDFRRIEQQELL
ncbi:MAG TPA: J domain-containing protein [Chroococcidiopsis sp.]